MRKICSVEGCKNYAYAKGLCKKHYQRLKRKGTTDDPAPRPIVKCAVNGCDRNAVVHGLCNMHYQRFRRNNSFERKYTDNME